MHLVSEKRYGGSRVWATEGEWKNEDPNPKRKAEKFKYAGRKPLFRSAIYRKGNEPRTRTYRSFFSFSGDFSRIQVTAETRSSFLADRVQVYPTLVRTPYISMWMLREEG
jgi:hypothetical protein